MLCPRCGTEATGAFCSTCGAGLKAASCRKCGAGLDAGARFCHACGHPVAAGAGTGMPAWLPWTISGALLAALLVVLVVRTGPGGAGPAAATQPVAPAAVPPAMRGGDISQLSPRQRADALYDRIMRLREQGQSDSVAFFKPMAVAAHQMLGDLDRDAQFHLGLIHAVSGTPDEALAWADSIERGAPAHLLAKIVRWEAARATGDAAAERRAAQAFLQQFEAERALDRPEYAAHPPMLDAYRERMGAGR
jgi:hypothetical protein